MRGTHYDPLIPSDAIGFTPAHAGNTPVMSTGRYFSGAHPRPCGEYFDDTGLPVYVSGSPPPMRGIQLMAPSPRRPGRFTPAHAGNTFRFSRRLFRSSVHPRTCGEYTSRNGHIKPTHKKTSTHTLFSYYYKETRLTYNTETPPHLNLPTVTSIPQLT